MNTMLRDPLTAQPAVEALRDEFDALSTQVTAATATAAHRLTGLADRLAILEQLAMTPAAQPGGGTPYQYASLGEWVDEVFTRLAARHRVRWCSNWEAHLEARARLEALWHTWEAANAPQPGGQPAWSAVDEWLRIVFDHHAAVLLDIDGPFAACSPFDRCSPPPRLAQRVLAKARQTAVARLDAYHARRHASGGR